MKFTRKGLHRLVAGNGAFISQHIDLNEAYERAHAHAQQQEAGEHRYRIIPAEIELVLITVKADVRPPTAPVISLGSISATSITVSLTSAATDTGGVASYSLERAPAAVGPFTEITANATFPYVDSSLTSSTTYHYRARATDLSGNVGNYSAITAATTQSPIGEWVANSPSYLPLLPGAAGRGFQQSAASGRHNVTAGLAAAPTIHFVTNLNLSGAGSARAALEATGDRIIIPTVSGLIDFSGLGDNSRQCIVGAGRVIWAGQCAPSPGLVLFGLQIVLNVATNANSLMWHLAAHQAPYTDFAIQAARGDTLNHFHAVGSPVLDSNIAHANCTYMWGNDETMDAFYGTNDFTFYQCLFAEALYNTANSNGTELGYGPLVGNDRTTALGEFIRCAMIHNSARNPLTRGALVSILNCLTFDTPNRGIQLSIEDGIPTQTNIEGNLAITGPGSNPSTPFFQQNTGGQAMTSACQVYLNGNRALGWTETTQAAMLSSGASTLVGSRIAAAYPAGYNVTPIDDRISFARLVARDCGARPGDRAAVHQRIFNHLEARLTGTGSQGGMIGFPSEVTMVIPANTVTHTIGTDPIPGIVSQSSTPTVLGAAGCGVMASGYTALEEWLWRKHLAVMQRTDLTAPNVPTISASAVSSTAITVSLTGASTDAGSGIWGYILERATNSSFTANLITEATGPAVFPRSVTGLSASTTYYFRARAVDNAGNVSAHSSTASATTQSVGGSTIAHGATVTTTGSGFGTKPTAAPAKYDDFTNGTVGNSIYGQSPIVGSAWMDNLFSIPPRYSNAVTRGVHTRSSFHRYQRTGPESYNVSLAHDTPAGTLTLYLDFWFRQTSDNGVRSRNQKIFRVYPATDQDDFCYYTTLCDNDSGYFASLGPQFIGYDSGSNFAGGRWPINGTWCHMEVGCVLSNPAGTANGRWFIYQNHLPFVDRNNVITRSSAQSALDLRQARVVHYCGTDGNVDCAQIVGYDVYATSVYIDTSLARVVLGNASTFAACTHREIQRPTAWSDTSVTYVANRGGLPAGSAWEFVINASNQVVNTRAVTLT